jgi:hypothetical protein
MPILNFTQFKLLLEAEETQPPVDPNQPTDQPPTDVAAAPVADTGGTTSFTPPTPSFDPGPSELPPDPNAPTSPITPRNDRLVFSSDSDDWHIEYSDGGGVKRYTEYELMPGELDQWISSSGLAARKDEITSSVKTGSPMPTDVYDKLLAAVKNKSLGKDRGIIDIEQDPSGKTSTSDLEIILLKSK